MLRVADMRATLGSKATALQLYQKVTSTSFVCDHWH